MMNDLHHMVVIAKTILFPLCAGLAFWTAGICRKPITKDRKIFSQKKKNVKRLRFDG